jgi:acetyl-CoA carboxylase biotin carboxyl carrier protein
LSEKKLSKKPGKPAAVTNSPMDVGLLASICKLMQANDLNTVDLRDGDRRVILKRGAVQAAPGYAPQHHAPAPVAALAKAPEAPAAAVDEESKLLAIKSPMVGTYYAAPSPDAKPFVSVGTTVNDETDVCVIEAMKVFNNVKAECRGSIARVLVTNGQAVEFGQTLFLVKP